MGTRTQRLRLLLGIMATGILWNVGGLAEEMPLTRNVPIPEFQNRGDIIPFYNFDAPPQGIFHTIQFAEGYELEMGFLRSHDYVPVGVTEVFRPDSPAVYVVFSTHQHYNFFQVYARCYPEHVEGLDPETLVDEDTMYVALEDNTGYLKLVPPPEGWRPGQYKVEIHVGFQVNEISLIGTMRFTVQPTGDSNSKMLAKPG